MSHTQENLLPLAAERWRRLMRFESSLARRVEGWSRECVERRERLVSWLFDLCVRPGYSEVTFCMATRLFDRYLLARNNSHCNAMDGEIAQSRALIAALHVQSLLSERAEIDVDECCNLLVGEDGERILPTQFCSHVADLLQGADCYATLDTTVYELAWTLVTPLACTKAKALARLDFLCMRHDASSPVNLRFDCCVSLLKYFALLATFDWNVRAAYNTDTMALGAFLLAILAAWRSVEPLTSVPIMNDIWTNVAGCTLNSDAFSDVVCCAAQLWEAARRHAFLSRSAMQHNALERSYREWLFSHGIDRTETSVVGKLLQDLTSKTPMLLDVDTSDEESPDPSFFDSVDSVSGSNESTHAGAAPQRAENNPAYVIGFDDLRARFGVPGRTLGEGTFGKVSVLYNTTAGRTLAVKKFCLRALDALANGWAVSIGVLREITLLRGLLHPHIAQVLHVAMSANLRLISLIMPCYGGGDLNQYQVPSAQVDSFVDQMVSAVNYLHQHALVHRDLKPANFVMDNERTTLHLIDFSLATRLDLVQCDTCMPLNRQYERYHATRRATDGSSRPLAQQWSICFTNEVCTVPYRAPELLALANEMEDRPYDGRAIDCWALGCVIAEMCRPVAPTRAVFSTCSNDTEATLALIHSTLQTSRERAQYFFERLATEASQSASSLCERLLSIEPSRRY